MSNKNEMTIYIDGMSCNHCKMTVEKALNAIDGVEAQVDLENKCAKITLSKDVDTAMLKDAVTNCGFTVK